MRRNSIVDSLSPGHKTRFTLQYWTEVILVADSHARLEHFKNLGYLPPTYKPKTLHGIAVVERCWHKWRRVWSVSRQRCTLSTLYTLVAPQRMGEKAVETHLCKL